MRGDLRFAWRMLRPLPVRHPEELARFVDVHPPLVSSELPGELREELRRHPPASVAAFAASIRVGVVSSNFFAMLGVHAAGLERRPRRSGGPPAPGMMLIWF